MVAVVGVLVGLPILDPIAGPLITATILGILKDGGLSDVRRLLDGIEPDILAQVEHAPAHVTRVQGIRDVHAR